MGQLVAILRIQSATLSLSCAGLVPALLSLVYTVCEPWALTARSLCLCLLRLHLCLLEDEDHFAASHIKLEYPGTS